MPLTCAGVPGDQGGRGELVIVDDESAKRLIEAVQHMRETEAEYQHYLMLDDPPFPEMANSLARRDGARDWVCSAAAMWVDGK